MKVAFKGWTGNIYSGVYPNGSTAWVLQDDKWPHEPIATITVALDELPQDGEIFIKDYSENSGMLAALVEQHIVEDTGKRLDAGYATNGVAVVKPLFVPTPRVR